MAIFDVGAGGYAEGTAWSALVTVDNGAGTEEDGPVGASLVDDIVVMVVGAGSVTLNIWRGGAPNPWRSGVFTMANTPAALPIGGPVKDWEDIAAYSGVIDPNG